MDPLKFLIDEMIDQNLHRVEWKKIEAQVEKDARREKDPVRALALRTAIRGGSSSVH